jgi:hypothetical protein
MFLGSRHGDWNLGTQAPIGIAVAMGVCRYLSCFLVQSELDERFALKSTGQPNQLDLWTLADFSGPFLIGREYVSSFTGDQRLSELVLR